MNDDLYWCDLKRDQHCMSKTKSHIYTLINKDFLLQHTFRSFIHLFSAEAQDSLAGCIWVGLTAPKNRLRQICLVQCLSSSGMKPMSKGGEVDICTLGSVVVEVLNVVVVSSVEVFLSELVESTAQR